MRAVAADFRFALRRLLATPLFSIFAVLSLALGVGVTTAVYSVIDSIFLKETGFRDPGRVVFVVTPFDGRFLQGSVSEPDFRDLRREQRSFSSISATTSFQPTVTTPSAAERLQSEAVDGAYFATLGVAAMIGRTISTRDDADGARVVVLSHRLWRVRFAANPRIVGQTIRISGHAFDVIGVAPPSFGGASGVIPGTSVWIPLTTEASLEPASTSPQAPPPRERERLLVFGRLAQKATVAAASAELTAIAANLDAAFPPRGKEKQPGLSGRTWKAKSVVDIERDNNLLRRLGLTLVALVGLVLAVACTNLANLVLARGTIRQQELTIRHALGASRWRLVREQCAESLLLAIGGALGATMVFQLLRAAIATDYSVALPFGGHWLLPIDPVLDPAALGVAAASLLLSLAVFGLEPALQLTRSLDLRGQLAEAGAGPTRTTRQRRLLRWQVAIAAGFFIVATMFVKYTVAEARHDSGVAIDRLGVAVVDAQGPLWDEARVRRTLDRLVEELRTDPSVEAVSVSTGMPFGVRALRLTLSVPGSSVSGETARGAMGVAATPSLFRTLGIPIMAGRGFDDRDGPGAPPVVVVSEFTARRMFGTADAVGRQLVVHGGPRKDSSATVIGVARDTDVRWMFGDPSALVYLPFAQRYDPLLAVAVRSTGDAAQAVVALQAALRRVDPDLPLDGIGTGRLMLAGLFVLLRIIGFSALALGGLTLLLAMAGLFGIQSHAVAARTREIGVRMSFGASPAQIQRMVLMDGCLPVLDGLALGVCVGLVGRVIAREYLQLDDVTILDPWMLVVVPIPVVLAGFCACYLPAHRAASVDPNVALRHL